MDGDVLNKRPGLLDSISIDEQLEADFDRALNEVSGAEERLRRKALEFETELLESIRLLDEVVVQLKASLRASESAWGDRRVRLRESRHLTDAPDRVDELRRTVNRILDSQSVTLEQLHRITHPIHRYRLEVAQFARGCPPLTKALRGIAGKALTHVRDSSSGNLADQLAWWSRIEREFEA